MDTFFLERIIENNTMICSMVGSETKSDHVYIGTKDGKVKIINVEKGESFRILQCFEQETAVVEMLAFER